MGRGKLVVFTLAHPSIHVIEEHFPESFVWKVIFWGVLLSIAISGYLVSRKKANKLRRSA